MVIVVHNRYRFSGGEERSVELQLAALARAEVPHRLIERSSGDASRVASGLALVRGGRPDEVVEVVREFESPVVHAHNIHPWYGPRSLLAARAAGARVVLELHNSRLFCAIAFASRDGGPCFRCRGRFTLPGLLLDCRGSIPEAVAYAAGLSLHQAKVWRAVDVFVTPSATAAEQLARLGLPRDRLRVVHHYLPDDAFAAESRAAAGSYALVLGRLSEEKGVDIAIEAAARAGVPLRIVGDGPRREELTALALRGGGEVAFLGRLGRPDVDRELRGAAMVALPSRFDEFEPYAALEAMAAGVPVLGTTLGCLPDLLGSELCVPLNDPAALAAAMRSLWDDPAARAVQGERLLAVARTRFTESRYVAELLSIYERR
jgi:glycosyltransferase involved in cell wall biosynthesis